MARQAQWPPSPHFHKPSGQARVRWQGKDHYLGPWQSEEAGVAYAALLERLQAEAAVLANPPPAPVSSITVLEILVRFLAHVEDEYDPRGRELEQYRLAFRPLSRLFGDMPAKDFDANKLEDYRKALTSGSWLNEEELAWRVQYSRQPNASANYANRLMGRVRTCWKWAEKKTLVPKGSYGNLKTADPVRPQARGVRRTKPREPTTREDLDKVLPAIQRGRRHRPVATMLEVQWYTGMRSCEVRLMRVQDINRTGIQTPDGPVWVYRVSEEANKMHWKGQLRFVLLGPECQRLLAPWLLAAGPDGYVFPVRHGGQTPYSRCTYAYRVRWTCKKVGVRICPYGGRHAARLRVTQAFDLDCARAFLGQKDLGTTLGYADQQDLATAARVAAKLA